jgi:hypothetical protein
MNNETKTRIVMRGGVVVFNDLVGIPGLAGAEAIICDYEDRGSAADDIVTLYVLTGELAGLPDKAQRLIHLPWHGFDYLGDASSLPPAIVAGANGGAHLNGIPLMMPPNFPPFRVDAGALDPTLLAQLLAGTSAIADRLCDAFPAETAALLHEMGGVFASLRTLLALAGALPQADGDDGRLSGQPVAQPLSTCKQVHYCCVCGSVALEAGHWSRGGYPNCHPDFKVRCSLCSEHDLRPEGLWQGPGLANVKEQDFNQMTGAQGNDCLLLIKMPDGRPIFYDVR